MIKRLKNYIFIISFLSFSQVVWSARTITSVTVDGASSTTVNGGETVTVSLTVITSGSGNNDNWDSTSYTLNGETTCVDTTDRNGDGTYTASFSVTAPDAEGSYSLSLYAHRNNSCTPSSDSNEFTLPSGVVVGAGGSSSDVNICSDSSSNDESGTLFDSGGASGNYDDDEFCTFIIEPASGNNITLEFDQFSLVSFFFLVDRLSIYDGTSSSGTLLASLTGTGLPSSFTASSGAMYLEFSSDFIFNSSGFEARWITSEPIEADFIISGQGSSFSSSSGDWSWDGSEHRDWRSAIENPTNFGSSGVVTTTVDTVDLSEITADSLSGIDAFVSSWWTTTQSAAYESLLVDFFLAGGDLVLLQDNTDRDGVGEELGIETVSNFQSGATAVTSPLNGSFGYVGSVSPRGQFGRLSESAITSRGGAVCGTDGAGQPTIACWSEGEYAAGAGSLVIVGDTDFLTSNDGGANYSTLNAKGRLGLNIIEFLINDEPSPSPLTTDHFLISHGGAGVTCASSAITITAVDSLGNIDTGYTGTIGLTTSTGNGDWSGGANGSGSDAGTASYTFNASDNGSVTFDYLNTHIETVNLNVSDGVISEVSGSAIADDDPDLSIVETGFLISSIPNTTAAAAISSVTLQAVRSSDGDASVCVPAFPDGTDIDVELAAECLNPSSCISGQSFQVSNNGNTALVSLSDDNSGAGASSYTSTTLRFGAQATATLDLNYTDVGEMQFHARYNIPLGDGSNTPSGNYMTGVSNAFISTPASFLLSATGNPSASDSNGIVYATAGDIFSVTVDVLNSTGSVAPNYGNESAPEGVALSPILVSPVAGDSGSLSGSVGRSNPGRFTGNLSWSEVGIMQIAASVGDGDYLGAGDVSTTSGNIGRFIPAGFTVASPSIGEACEVDGFTYIGQGFSGELQVTAVNGVGDTTRNYEGSYAKLGSDFTASPSTFDVGGSASGTDFSSRLNGSFSSASSQFVDGVATLTTSLLFSRLSNDQEFFLSLDTGITFSDGDGVSLLDSELNLDTDSDTNDDFYQLGTSTQQFGRLRVSDRHGPESSSLSVPFLIEVWNGSLFVPSVDSCSAIAAADIAFDGESIAVDLDADVGSGSTAGSFLDFSGGNVNIVVGDAGLSFSAPGVPGSFPITVDLTNYPWLQFNWNRDASSANDTAIPPATISFGSYRGHDRVIYWQERF